MSANVFQPVVLLSQGNAVSITGTLTETTLASMVLKAGMVNKNDYIEFFSAWSYTNVARNKTLTFKIGTSSMMSHVPTSTLTAVIHREIGMRGTLASQVAFGASASLDNGTSSTALSTFTEDLSVDKTLALTGTLSNTGDTITLECIFVVLWKEQNPL